MKIIGGPGGGYLTTPVLDHFREKGIGMSEQTKVVVPEGMLAAVLEADPCVAGHEGVARHHIEVALLWQKEHPRVPMQEQYDELHKKWHYDELTRESPAIEFQRICHAWIRRMYDVPVPSYEFGICSICGADGKRRDTTLAHFGPSGQVMPGHRVPETEVSTASKPKEVDDRLCPVCGIDRTKMRTTWAHSFVNGKLGCGHKEPPTVEPSRSEVEIFAPVPMFCAILERPATAADEPISEREKQQGIRENVTCVRAEDYSRLLKAYRELVKKTAPTVDNNQ
jgi:hypothetical protein